MADISKIRLNGTNYNVKDAFARGGDIILVGDSFGEVPSVSNNWQTKVMSALPNKTIYRCNISGGGFGSPVKLLTALQGIENQVTTPANVKMIIVQCGTNDHGYVSDIAAGVASFSTYVKQHYPNATVYVLFTSLQTDYASQAAAINNVPVNYMIACAANENTAFVEDSVYMYRNYSEVGLAGIHPLESGADTIARGVINFIKSFTMDIKRKRIMFI